MKDDHYFIRQCLQLAKQALEKGNSEVGAVITMNGELICEAEEATKTKNDITCHAEIEVMRKAVALLQTNDLSDCTLYSTHEPCVMCAYAIRFYKISKVVYVETSAYLGSVSSDMPLLTSNNVPPHWSAQPVVVQLLQAEEIHLFHKESTVEVSDTTGDE